MKYWHQQFGATYATAEEVPGGSILAHILEAIEQSKVIRKPAVTCYLISQETWDRLRERIPLQDAEPHKGLTHWPGKMTYQGIPIFVYASDEERITLRLSLMQAGHIVGEVQNGPVL